MVSRRDLLSAVLVPVRRMLAAGALLSASACAGSEGASGTGSSSTAPPAVTPLQVTTPASLPAGRATVEYGVQLEASGSSAAAVWTVSDGSLPPGLGLSATGRLAGTPVAAGSFTFTVRVADGARTGTATFRLEVEAAPIEILPEAIPFANVGSDYSVVLSLAGAQGRVSWSLVGGALPAGLVLQPDGTLRGVPIVIVQRTVRIRAVADNKTRERDIVVRVLPPPLSIQTTTLPNGNVGTSYAAQLERRGGDATIVWELVGGALPPGMTLSSAGMLAGVPTAAGSHDFTVSAFSDPQRATQRLRLVIDPPFTYPTTVLVEMPGDFFTPALAYLAAGGTVTWRFPARAHNVVFTTSGSPADIPLISNATISRTFPTAGTFRYDCTVHPGMSGIVVVGRP